MTLLLVHYLPGSVKITPDLAGRYITIGSTLGMGFFLLARRDWAGGGGFQGEGSGGVGEGAEIIPGGNLIGPTPSLWFGGS